MPYVVEITETAEKEIRRKIDRSLLGRLDARIQRLAEDPYHGKPLRGPLAGVWEIRFENRWRLTYIMRESEKKVILVGVKHKDEM